jgi:hypothetical protein
MKEWQDGDIDDYRPPAPHKASGLGAWDKLLELVLAVVREGIFFVFPPPVPCAFSTVLDPGDAPRDTAWEDLTANHLKVKYEKMKKALKDVWAKAEQTGGGSLEDEDYLNKKCPCFHELNLLEEGNEGINWKWAQERAVKFGVDLGVSTSACEYF